MDEGRRKSRIGWFWGTILISLAVIADIIGLIPFLESFSGSAFWAIAGFILWKRGCGLLNWKRLVTMALSLAIGWMPAFQALPQLTGGIAIIIFLVVMEDRTGVSLTSPLSKGQKVRLPNRPGPLNRGGVREPRQEV
ncbi:MAG: hypothetical protein Q8Q03_03080 [bacterium]|nr:hypothetical protein [bacterium]